MTVADTFADACDPAPARRYTPGPGPSYAEHGDWGVRLDVEDVAGNSASASTAFRIDLVPPDVALVEPPPSLVRPPAVPFAVVFGSTDDDGAAGGVTHEWVTLNGCVIFDGATHGDGDGLLSDESVVIDERERCRILSKCGFGRLDSPTIAVYASDCGGNTGSATRSWRGSLPPPARQLRTYPRDAARPGRRTDPRPPRRRPVLPRRSWKGVTNEKGKASSPPRSSFRVPVLNARR